MNITERNVTDLHDLKAKYDLRLIVEADLGPARCRGGKALPLSLS